MSLQSGNPNWHARRLGKVTASRVFSIVDTDKSGKPKAAYDNLMHELAIERITNTPTPVFVNLYMADGTRQEPIARVTYELEHGVDVEQVQFVDHPTIEMSGASPDGLVELDGLIEIKAPQPKTFTEYMLNDRIPPEYNTQIHWQFACMPERKWCDFVAFCDKMPPELRMHVKRILRDDSYVEKLERAVREFNQKTNDLTDRLRKEIARRSR
jgi:hypothetical protein